MTPLTHRFQDLQVYQFACQCAVEVHDLVQQFSEDSHPFLTQQCLSTSRAVCAHIAAAWGQQRLGPAWAAVNRTTLIGQLSAAQFEAMEMQIWLEAAICSGCLEAAVGQDLYDRYRCLIVTLDQLMEKVSLEGKPFNTSNEDTFPTAA